jgi:hypothetical protein
MVLFFSCENVPENVKNALKMAGKNKKELQKIITHYKKTGNKNKLKAAYFLIGNMEDKYSVTGGNLNEYFKLLKKVGALKDKGIKRDSLDLIMKLKYDSLVSKIGGINYDNLKIESDLQTINSSFLIKNIDLAFEAWSKPWAKHICFDDFCEFILPYRIKNEPLSNWREHFYKELISVQNLVNNKSDPKELIEIISNSLYKKWNHFYNYSSYSFYPDLIEMEKCNGGLCDHRYYLFVGMCRSIGLPVSIESTPQWTTASGGHAWNVFIDTNGRIRPFNGAEDNFRFYEKNLIPMGDGSLVCTKVYRETFAVQKESLPFIASSNDQIPPFFKNKYLIDVTSNYDFPKVNRKLKFSDRSLNNKIVYLNSFDYGFTRKIVAWAKIKNNEAIFNDIGIPAFYTPILFVDGQPKQVYKPLLLTVDEKYQQEYNPDSHKTGTVKLFRKFYMSGDFISFAQGMVGAKFQGSNKPDFSDAVDLYTINKKAKGYEEVMIDIFHKFRFIRYFPLDSSPVRIAELEFWGMKNNSRETKLEGKIIGQAGHVDRENNAIFKNAFDDNIRTNFNAKAGSWVGIDLGENNRARITRIWFLPRNNYNEIEKNHNYELFYLADDWISLGQKKANSHYLIYHNVPKNAMLLLRDLTEGRQERIFMYDQDKKEQYWW